MANSLITSEVPFDQDGKHTGFLRVPHSVTSSAYGWLPIPICVIQNGTGPTLLISAGNHGDEYEGQIAVTKLIQSLEEKDIQGRLILLPTANAPAAEAGTRTSPIDNGNLNRSFPGDPAGTPTQMIAHYVEEVLLPMCDYTVDLHSGGTSLHYPATLLRGPAHTPEEEAGLNLLSDAFDLPYAWVFTGGGGKSSTARTAMGAANRKGVINVMAELGGGGTITPDILADTERGLQRILHALQMLPAYEPGAPRGTRALNAQCSVFAYDSGLLELLKDIGNPVTKGDTIALIHDPATPWRAPIPVTSPYEGIVLAKRHLTQVKRGDAVVQIAQDAS
ncbi:MAG: succinylglutamate desuccinylase/aspartoacylase family protein [Shimia sp.]|uniref:succinylglutamate desuccinylase/aspartoacylase family protein n=1 Tax=Shimia sp. TaxID=1954381 RepID=UPI0025DEFAAE|nr:succinylglutamate desuccinylase/aspartoacylase family protein [Shimia sp.]MCH2067995.1 succinylglutamate desuccinylase/aspartoacylase family protein [Shimia sp.]